MAAKRGKGKGRPPIEGFVTQYFDRRTGRWMRAADYGYKAWPFGGRKRRP